MHVVLPKQSNDKAQNQTVNVWCMYHSWLAKVQIKTDRRGPFSLWSRKKLFYFKHTYTCTIVFLRRQSSPPTAGSERQKQNEEEMGGMGGCQTHLRISTSFGLERGRRPLERWTAKVCRSVYTKTGKRNLSVRKCTDERVMRAWCVMWAETGTSVQKDMQQVVKTWRRGTSFFQENSLGLRERRWLKNGTLNDMYHLNSRGWRIKNTCQRKLLWVGVGEQQCSRSDVGIWKSCRGNKFPNSTVARSARCTEGSCECLVWRWPK